MTPTQRMTALIAGATILVAAPALRAQDPAPASPAPAPAAAGGAEATAVPAAPNVSPEAAQTIETIMREKEDLITGKRFSYDPSGRRDPFRSLIEEVRRDKGQRPKGISGMGIGEVDLVGVVKDPAGDVAVFQGSDNKGYFLRVGAELFDGRLIGIEARTGVVTFRQQVDDPRQIKPYRDIVKRLVPLEEEGQ